MPCLDITEFERFCKAEFQEQLAWVKEHFLLPDIKVDFQFNYRGRGDLGVAGVSRNPDGSVKNYYISLHGYNFLHFPVQAATEYRRFNGDPVIGGFMTDNWQLSAATVIAHEFTHIIQFAFRSHGEDHPMVELLLDGSLCAKDFGAIEMGHGDFFQNIYRVIRQELINHRVEGHIGLDHNITTFVFKDTFEADLAAMPASPINGFEIDIKDRKFTVVGRNPRRSVLMRYILQDQNGKLFRASLRTIAKHSLGIQELVANNPDLSKEYQEHLRQFQIRENANMKISETLRRRSKTKEVT
jgi:hypothetical protein